MSYMHNRQDTIEEIKDMFWLVLFPLLIGAIILSINW